MMVCLVQEELRRKETERNEFNKSFMASSNHANWNKQGISIRFERRASTNRFIHIHIILYCPLFISIDFVSVAFTVNSHHHPNAIIIFVCVFLLFLFFIQIRRWNSVLIWTTTSKSFLVLSPWAWESTLMSYDYIYMRERT